MPIRIRAEVVGMEKLTAKLQDLQRAQAKRVLRKGLAAAGKVLRQEIKARLPKGPPAPGERFPTGITAKNVVTKMKTYRTMVVASIRTRPGLEVVVGTRTRGKSKGRPIVYQPGRVAHLREFGHGGPHPAPAHEAWTPAVASQGSAAGAAFEAAAWAEVQKIAAAG